MADNVQPTQVKDSNIAVASATPRKPLSAEEKRALHKSLRERMQRSRLQVDGGDPNFHYSWARKDDDTEMARLEYLGYEVVKEDPKVTKIKANGKRADGTFIVGDVILVRCPMDVWEFLIEDNAEKSHEIAFGAQSQFAEEAAKKNVPTFRVEKKEE